MAAHTTAGQWPLAARDDQLGAFEELWGRRSCHGVVIAGAAGVGKTRLGEECLARAVRAGFKGRRAAASRLAAQIPLEAVAHLIPAGVDMSNPVQGFAETARSLAGPGRDRHWAVLVDDVHLLDAASVVLLRQLMDTGRVRLIGTLRTDETAGEAVAALSGQDTVGRIDLDAFDEGQAEKVLEAALGGPVARRTVHELFRISGGNALYLHELVLGALGDGSLSFDGEIWQLSEGRAASAPRLGELITARLAAAAPLARDVLDLLALCEPVSLADTEAAAGDPQIMVDLEEAGLVQVRTEQRRIAVSLAHPLYGETLRARIPALRHRQLLLAQVDRTEAHGARRREDAQRICAWQLAATGTADPAQLIRAAAIARHAHDYPLARTLLEALPENERTTATRLLHGEVLFELGGPDAAEQVLKQADAHAVTEPEVLAVIMARTFNLFWSAGRTTRALEVNDAARSRATSGSSQRMLRYNEGWMRIHCGEPARGLQLLSDLADDIDDAEDLAGWIFGMAMRPVGLALVGQTGPAVAAAQKTREVLLDIAGSALAPHPAASLNVLAFALAEHGQLARARDMAEQGYTELTYARIPMPRIWTAMQVGRIELLAGHPATARRWFADVAAMARDKHAITPMHPALCGIAASAAVLGDLEAARRALTEANDYPPLPILLDLTALAQGWLASAQGDLTAAQNLLSDAAEQAKGMEMLSCEAWLLTEVARLGGAGQVTDRLAKLAQACDGAFTPARAHLAAALTADDPEQLLHTASELEAIGADLLAAEAAAAAAVIYQHDSQARKATAAARVADTSAAHCEGARTALLNNAHATAQLTARERDIALLAAHGTSSQDIAEKLHLSVRTVENHLQHAYTKLGVTTRRELATALETTSSQPAA